MNEDKLNIGRIIKQQRVNIPMTLQKLAAAADVSPSYLGRIERGDRIPSARILRRIARPLNFNEDELFILAGYLNAGDGDTSEAGGDSDTSHLDPNVAKFLAQESINVQRMAVTMLGMMKGLNSREKPPENI